VIEVRDTRRTRLFLGVLLLAALALVALDYQDGSSSVFRAIRHVSGSVFGGAERTVSAVTSPVARFFGGSSGSASSSQVTALQQQVIRLRAELSQEQLSKADYAQLQRLLQLAGQGGYRIVAATVIAIGQGYAQTITLDAGTDDGVQPQETVLTGQGLVGEVTAVTSQTCTVTLATDASSVVGVELAPSGQLGWVTGPGKTASGTGQLSLKVLNASAVLKPGEQLVTSASVNDRPFVPGVPVGVISKVQNSGGALTGQARVQPYVDFTSLSVVGIVVAPPVHNPRFSVLPPSPRARPTPTVTVTVTPGATPGASAPATPAPGSSGGG
jgi:rod shape-determining protein MreC